MNTDTPTSLDDYLARLETMERTGYGLPELDEPETDE